MADGVIKFVQQTGTSDGADAPVIASGETGLYATERGLVVATGSQDKWFLDKPTFLPGVGSVNLTDSWQDLTGEFSLPDDIGTEDGCQFSLNFDIYGDDVGSNYRVNGFMVSVFIDGSQWGPWNFVTVRTSDDGSTVPFRIPVSLTGLYGNPGNDIVIKAAVVDTDYQYENVGVANAALRRDYYLD